MKLATVEDYDEICLLFKKYKHIFPHIRFDYIKRSIEEGKVIYQDDVVIIFNKYKRTQAQGHLNAQKGDYHLKQIAIAEQGKGNAREVVEQFFAMAHADNAPVWLSVRSDNERARAFYTKVGMKEVSETSWAKGAILGTIYKKD